MAQNDLLYLDRAVGAWNVDGSSDALAESGSWLRDAEEATGRKRGRCSFEGCLKQAEVGGHMWITGMGCFIAPICRSCNRHDNQDRMQGAGARLRENIVVTRTEMTNGMHTATRRIAGGRRRRCQSCGDDISDRPANHASCLECWSGDAGDRRGGRGRRRRCESCHDDISNKPASHTRCRECWSRSGRKGGRVCQDCDANIAGAPSNHVFCQNCFSS